MRRLAGLLVAVALALGGCGLPSNTEPKYLGAAATATPAPDETKAPFLPQGARDARELISRFLQTSVGGNGADGDQPETATETRSRMRTFLSPEMQARWHPGKEVPLTVVRATIGDPLGLGQGGSSVPVVFHQIGTLNEKGELQPVQQPDFEFDFQVESTNGTLLLSEVPSDKILFSAVNLSDWYDEQPLYFWEKDVDAPKLVPDLRYMPKVLTSAKRVAEVLRWLKLGPSWLAPVVAQVPSDIETKDNPTVSSTGVKVNLTLKALTHSQDDLRRLASQIRWSLPDHPPVSLTIEGQAQDVDSNDYANDNVAVMLGETDPEKFSVAAQVARPVVGNPPALFNPGGQNTLVIEAALNRAKTQAALVRQVGAKQKLFISAPGAAAQAADSNTPAKYVEVPDVVAARLSRPVWINRPVPRLLVSDGTRLLAVTPPVGDKGPEVEPVTAGTQPTGITAFAVAPDGRRIALIIGGDVMVAPVLFDGAKLTLGAYRQLTTSLGANEAVGWVTETELAVGGKPNPALQAQTTYSLVSVTIDGTEESPLPSGSLYATASYDISKMAVRTKSPLDESGGVLILFEANGVAHTVYKEEIQPIVLSATVSPSASPTADKTTPSATAPFYTD